MREGLKERVGTLEHELAEIRILLLAPKVAMAASNPRDTIKKTHEGCTIWIDPMARINVLGTTHIQPANDIEYVKSVVLCDKIESYNDTEKVLCTKEILTGRGLIEKSGGHVLTHVRERNDINHINTWKPDAILVEKLVTNMEPDENLREEEEYARPSSELGSNTDNNSLVSMHNTIEYISQMVNEHIEIMIEEEHIEPTMEKKFHNLNCRESIRKLYPHCEENIRY